jgi:endonuclease III
MSGLTDDSANSFAQIHETLLLTKEDSLDSLIENLHFLLEKAKKIKDYSTSIMNGDYI